MLCYVQCTVRTPFSFSNLTEELSVPWYNPGTTLFKTGSLSSAPILYRFQTDPVSCKRSLKVSIDIFKYQLTFSMLPCLLKYQLMISMYQLTLIVCIQNEDLENYRNLFHGPDHAGCYAFFCLMNHMKPQGTTCRCIEWTRPEKYFICVTLQNILISI